MFADLTPLTMFTLALIWLVGGLTIYHLLSKKPGKLEWLFVVLILFVLVSGTIAVTSPSIYGGNPQVKNHYSQNYIESNSP